MDDLISRAAAIEAGTDWKVKPDGEIFNAIKAACRSKIEQIPAVDAVPVVHGRWIERYGDLECSECHTMIEYEVLWHYRNSDYQTIDEYFRYCPYCGAKMDRLPGREAQTHAETPEAVE